jgi:hypothetical protein
MLYCPIFNAPGGNVYMAFIDIKMISLRTAAFRDVIFDKMAAEAKNLWAEMFSS